MLKKGRRILRWLDMVHNYQCRRHESALYITGDKAMDNYSSLQPYLDFQETLSNLEALQQSITARGLKINLPEILRKHRDYAGILAHVEELEQRRMANSQAISLRRDTEDNCDELKAKGRLLREQLKELKKKQYPIEEDFVFDFLKLPNKLHKHCPSGGYEKLIFQNCGVSKEPKSGKHLDSTELIRFIDQHKYYLMGAAAKFDLKSTLGLTRYCADVGGFQQIANPDFVRRVLIEASGIPLDVYAIVKEDALINHLNVAYLTGGGAFESFLAALTKLAVSTDVLPMKFVCCGRSYAKGVDEAGLPGLYSAVQSNTVQTLVATRTPAEADEEFESILHLAVTFYKTIGLRFRITYEDASKLTIAESLRASIEAYSPPEQRYVSIGHISNYGDFISKRILFTVRRDKQTHFLHLVGGPLLYTSRLAAALLEQGISLTDCNILRTEPQYPPQKPIDVFKSLFS